MIPSRALDRLAFSLSLSLLSKNCIWRLLPPRVFNKSWMLFCDRLTCSSDEDVSRRNLMSVDVGRGRTWRCSEERPWCFLSLTSSLTYVYSWFWLHIGTLIRHHDMKIPFLFFTSVFIACFRRQREVGFLVLISRCCRQGGDQLLYVPNDWTTSLALED